MEGWSFGEVLDNTFSNCLLLCGWKSLFLKLALSVVGGQCVVAACGGMVMVVLSLLLRHSGVVWSQHVRGGILTEIRQDHKQLWCILRLTVRETLHSVWSLPPHHGVVVVAVCGGGSGIMQ